MTPVLPIDRVRPPGRTASSDLVDALLAVVLGIIVIVPVAARLELPPVVPEIRVVNPTQYDFHVAARGDSDRGVLGLGVVERGSDATFRRVLDQGKTWVFQFQYGGESGGDITIRRQDLERNGWTVTIPEESGRRLAEIGMAPSSD